METHSQTYQRLPVTYGYEDLVLHGFGRHEDMTDTGMEHVLDFTWFNYMGYLGRA